MPSPEPPSTPRPPRLQVEGVSVSADGVEILRGVSLTVPARQVVGVIGTNGAGKTTLLDTIAGVRAIDGGSLLLDGEPHDPDPTLLPELGLARTIQGFERPEGRLVLDHVLAGFDPPRVASPAGAVRRAFGRTVKRARSGLGLGAALDAERFDAAVAVIKAFGLSRVVDAELQTLSTVTRARAEIASAAVVGPRLLLLDEPTAGLGRAEREELAGVIRSFATDPRRDCSVVLVDHHYDLIAAACDHVVVLDGGAVVASGTPAEVAADPVAVAAYLDDGAGEG